MLGRPLIPCIGCGAPVPDTDGATHRCFGASPGCRAAFGEVLAREYGEYAYPGVHGLTVDAYAVQHQGRPSRQTIQSLAIHLVGLYVLLERGYTALQSDHAPRRLLRHGPASHWLEQPPDPGWLTVRKVVDAVDLADHERRARSWAKSV